MIKAVVFDMDGVLVNSEPENLRILKEFMMENEVEPSDEFLASLIGTSYDVTCEKSAELMGKDWSMEAFREGYEAYDLQHPYDYGKVLNPQVKETLDWLKEHEYRIALASSSPIRLIYKMLEECGLEEYFEVITSGENFDESKPNPEIYLHTIEKLGLQPSECMAVEDSVYGIEAALRAGMEVCAYRDYEYDIDQSAADHIVDHMLDIINYL